METQCPALLRSPGKLPPLLQPQFLQEETKTAVPLLVPFQIVSSSHRAGVKAWQGMAVRVSGIC